MHNTLPSQVSDIHLYEDIRYIKKKETITIQHVHAPVVKVHQMYRNDNGHFQRVQRKYSI